MSNTSRREFLKSSGMVVMAGAAGYFGFEQLVRATLELGPAGELQAMRLDRWSDLTDDHTYGPVPFESRIDGERSFGDLTIPSELHATWWAGTDRAFRFFEAAVDDASFTA